MTLLHQAAQKAVEALTHVTTSETFFRDPRGDLAGPAIDALESALQQQEVPSGAVIPPAPPECETEDEKTAFAFGYWKGLHAARKGQEVPREPVAENDAFDEWWESSGQGACPSHTLTTENCARATWHERARRAAASPSTPESAEKDDAGGVGAAAPDKRPGQIEKCNTGNLCPWSDGDPSICRACGLRAQGSCQG